MPEVRTNVADKSRRQICRCTRSLKMRKSTLVAKQIELEKEQQQTARAQREASALQMAVKSYVESIVKSVNPRSITFDHSRFDRIVKRLPAGRAEILYEPNDPEARDFASLIHGAFSGAGWSVGNSIQPAGAAGWASSGLGVRARNR